MTQETQPDANAGFPRETVREIQATATVVVHLPLAAGDDLHAAITTALTAQTTIHHGWVQHVDDFHVDVATDGETGLVAVVADAGLAVWHHPTDSTLVGPPDRAVERVLRRRDRVLDVFDVAVRESYTVERYD